MEQIYGNACPVTYIPPKAKLVTIEPQHNVLTGSTEVSSNDIEYYDYDAPEINW